MARVFVGPVMVLGYCFLLLSSVFDRLFGSRLRLAHYWLQSAKFRDCFQTWSRMCVLRGTNYQQIRQILREKILQMSFNKSECHYWLSGEQRGENAWLKL